MIVKTFFTAANAHLTVRVSGDFRFSDHRAFIQAYSQNATQPSRVTLDLAETTEVDSAALGMMLMLGDFVGGAHNVEIVGAQGQVAQIMKVARLDRTFGTSDRLAMVA